MKEKTIRPENLPNLTVCNAKFHSVFETKCPFYAKNEIELNEPKIIMFTARKLA